MDIYSEPFIFDIPPLGNKNSLKLTAKRYTCKESNDNGITLLLAHCVGAHKEQWEPTLQRIFALQQSQKPSLRIREAWSVDWQNHGDAAIINEQKLWSRPMGVSSFEWAPAIASFLKENLLRGHRVVAIGHSAGAGTLMIVANDFSPGKSPFVSIFLVEPTMVSRRLYAANYTERQAESAMSTKLTHARRDVWPSREDAFQWLSKRTPWKCWDTRVLRLYVEHGLRPMNTGDGTDSSVTLKCTKYQEGITYTDKEPHIEATEIFRHLRRTIPIHVVFGTRNDFFPLYIQEALVDESEGRIPASFTRIRGAGHLIVQEKPDELADAICNSLNTAEKPLISRL